MLPISCSIFLHQTVVLGPSQTNATADCIIGGLYIKIGASYPCPIHPLPTKFYPQVKRLAQTQGSFPRPCRSNSHRSLTTPPKYRTRKCCPYSNPSSAGLPVDLAACLNISTSMPSRVPASRRCTRRGCGRSLVKRRAKASGSPSR